MPDLENITITLCEQNGDGISSYNVNNKISAMIPNVGDEVHVIDRFRKVTNKEFQFLENTKTIFVRIFLEK